MSKGLSRKLWTTRDLQDAAAAGALFAGFESEEDDEDDEEVEDVEAAGVDEDVAAAPDVLLAAPERLSVR